MSERTIRPRVSISSLTRYLTCLLSVTLFLFSPFVQATTFPDISGTFAGTLPGTETVCTAPTAVTGNFLLSFTQNGGSISGSGTNNGTKPGDAFTDVFTFSGTIDTLGNVNATLSGTTDDGTAPIGGSFMGTLSGEILNLTFIYSDLGPPNCTWNYSGTLTRTSGDIIVDPAITPSSTLTAPLLLNTQVQNITSDLGTRIGDVLRGTSLGLQRTTSGFLFNTGPTGLNAGDEPITYGGWASYSYSDYDNDLISTAFDGYTHSVLAGFDFAPSDKTVLGIAFGYENSDVDTIFNRGNQEMDGFTVAPYFGMLLTDTWSFDISVGYSRLESDQFRIAPGSTTRITSSPDADRWFGMVNLNGVTTWDNWILGGRTGILRAKNTTEAFTESDGTAVPEIRSELGQWSIGGDAAYSFGEWEPFARVTYQHDFSLTEITVVGGGPQPSNDRDDVLVSAGIRYFNANGWTGNLEWNKRLGRDDFDEDTISLTIRAEF